MGWAFNRMLYSAKLRLLCALPQSEGLFEKTVSVKRTDVFHINTDDISKFLCAIESAAKDAIIKTADSAASGRIKGFSSIELDYGYPLNWQMNPLTGKSCSIKDKWFEIADFDKDRGDIKLVWEASRFTHFYHFARAYMITHDKRYYKAFSEQLNDWLTDNPYSFGANYKCGQECALRMVNALAVYSVFSSYGLTTQEDAANVAELTGRCYRKILSNFFYAHKCIRNNHTLSELCGMIVGAWCCCDDVRLKDAYALFDSEVLRQFTADGGYLQFSFNYQRFAMQICECVMSISQTTGIALSKEAKERIKRSALLMYQCQSESGDVPNYGSNDGALVFPVTSCGYRDFRPAINTSYAMTTGKCLYPDGLYDEELLWFQDGPCVFEKTERKSESFPDAGLYTLRGSDTFAVICLNDYHSRPAHMDQLHLDMWHKGRNVLCDCGTYSYASELGKELSQTAAHNTVKADSAEQMNHFGKFMTYNWTKALDIHHDNNTFKGFMVSKNGYSHQRNIARTDDNYTLNDTVHGCEQYEILFHTQLNINIDKNIVTLSDDKSIACTIQCDTDDINVSTGSLSKYYYQTETAAGACGTMWASSPTRRMH